MGTDDEPTNKLARYLNEPERAEPSQLVIQPYMHLFFALWLTVWAKKDRRFVLINLLSRSNPGLQQPDRHPSS